MKKRRLTSVSIFHYIRLCYRGGLFLWLLVDYILFRIHRREDIIVNRLEQWPLILVVVWIVFVVEMILRFFPSRFESPGCQKQFARNYIKSGRTEIVSLSVEASADRSEVYKIPGGVVRFTITVRNESAVEVKNISLKAVEREVYFFDSIPSGASRTVTRDMEISMAGNFQFTANAKDELGQVVSFASNVIPIAYAPPTPVPTEAPLVTPPAPATVALPQETASPAWIPQTERIADVAKWVFTGIAGVLCILLLIGAVRRGHSKSQSNKAMDHLEGANYRDYSIAPKHGKRNEVISGEEERIPQAEPAQEPAEAPQATAVKEEQSDGLMAETLKRLYDEPVKTVEDVAAEGETTAKEAAEAAEDAAKEIPEAMKNASEETAEATKADGELVLQTIQEATRRRRNGKA